MPDVEPKPVQSYQDLRVWQFGMDLVELVYAITAGFPADERYGLTAQIRRSAVSIPSNIAEGYGRESRQEFIRFLRIANGSLKEIETQLLIASRLGIAGGEDPKRATDLADQLRRMLRGLVRSLEERQP